MYIGYIPVGGHAPSAIYIYSFDKCNTNTKPLLIVEYIIQTDRSFAVGLHLKIVVGVRSLRMIFLPSETPCAPKTFLRKVVPVG